MADTLNYLIESETRRRMDAQLRLPLLTYGVWVDGIGWLKDTQTKRCFASVQLDVAESAAKLFGAPARVLPFDESLNTLADIFLRREQERIAQSWRVRFARWIKTWRG